MLFVGFVLAVLFSQKLKIIDYDNRLLSGQSDVFGYSVMLYTNRTTEEAIANYCADKNLHAFIKDGSAYIVDAKKQDNIRVYKFADEVTGASIYELRLLDVDGEEIYIGSYSYHVL